MRMDSNYTDLINDNKFTFILILLSIIVITVLTDCGITLFRKYRHTWIAVPHAIIPLDVNDIDVISYNVLHLEDNAEKLKEVIRLALSNDDAFFVKFNELDADFRKGLLKLAPDLVSTELEFCALLKLNFDTKEIARFTDISVRAVEAKKYRIRKKLNIGSREDINIFMVNI